MPHMERGDVAYGTVMPFQASKEEFIYNTVIYIY